MSLQNAIDTQEDAFINEPITATVTWPKTQPKKDGGVFYKATLTDGQFKAGVMCHADIFSANDNKRVTFSGHGKGATLVRAKNYNGKPQLSFGPQVSISPAGQATPDQQAAEQHSQQTQAFPVNTGNTPAPQRQQQRQGVEGVVAGMATNNGILLFMKYHKIEEWDNGRIAKGYASDIIRLNNDLQAGNLSIPPNDESRAGDWDDGQGESPPF
jgi:hypothetical protein